MRKHLRALLALITSLALAVGPAGAQGTGRTIHVVTLYDLSATAETWCSLATGTVTGPAPISAATSNTVTSSGTPFALLNVGDELQITQANQGANNGAFTAAIQAKASSSSITAAYRNPTTPTSSATLTLVNASFISKKLTCGTGNNDGIIPVNYGPWSFTFFVYAYNFATRIDWRLQCRNSAGDLWTQVFPATTSQTASYQSATAAGYHYSTQTLDAWAECRVGMLGVGADGGVNAVSVTASMRNF